MSQPEISPKSSNQTTAQLPHSMLMFKKQLEAM
jgi:hypothetical protein